MRPRLSDPLNLAVIILSHTMAGNKGINHHHAKVIGFDGCNHLLDHGCIDRHAIPGSLSDNDWRNAPCIDKEPSGNIILFHAKMDGSGHHTALQLIHRVLAIPVPESTALVRLDT